jgi:hypothetical protein
MVGVSKEGPLGRETETDWGTLSSLRNSSLHRLFLACFTGGSTVGKEVFAESSVTVGQWERGKDISTSSTGLHTDRASSGLDLVMPALASSSRNYTHSLNMDKESCRRGSPPHSQGYS